MSQLDPHRASQSHIPLPYQAIYEDGEYLKKNPTWHVEESPFKAKYVFDLLERNRIAPKTICEAGCGVGEALRQLQLRMPKDCDFWGYDISPQAFAFAEARANDHLHFRLSDITQEKEAAFDMLLILDVVEHVEDYFSFLRALRPRAAYKVLHLPLDISVQAVARKDGMMKRREDHAHIHYFTKEIALAVLRDTGYTVLDWSYLPRSNELGQQLIQKLFRVPRSLLFAVNRDLAVRVLGGYSLLVLAK